ncbi:5-deoxy-glucuronate isomerase [Plantibacter sp. CFBP 8775]|uniref:5-deoxy-glucuronate isomerase n=1 Tax=Plantibacter sp. CFBP 8775 TaxID=2774038 RepID=UPI001787445A|nr:5-deoxy-glucuronate isomerase [Plantibacter sp. CFBP 8775]MBD8102778.1 5-deoxy-glucuronate isomerase [Plantibacter sp. CFBP 8775]
MQWMYERGDLARDGWESVVDGSIDGWAHTGLRVAVLADGDAIDLPAGDVERIVVPLAGSFSISWSDAEQRYGTTALSGRRSVFDGPTDVLYVGARTACVLSGVGRVAVAEAPTTAIHPTRHVAAEEIPVELRGAGRSSRQVHNFGTPDALDAAKLIVCEVVTPAENWSSYPAHKHDERLPGAESRLEEIYYFESAVSKGLEAPTAADPFGMFATYSSPAGEIDINAIVRTGDIALVPFGYHGPAVAAPGYDLYYLNVMAGPDQERVWNISDDPAHAWIRQTWEGQDIDPRLPYAGPTATQTNTRSDAEGQQ